MNNKIKYSLVIILTLMIGFVIGFLVSGRLTDNRVDKMKRYYAEQGFASDFMRVLKPSPEQKKELKPIFVKYGSLNRKLTKEHIETQIEMFNELEKEITPYLTEEQINRLQKLKERWRKRKSEKRFNKGSSGERRPSK